ncbi:MAG: cytochrome P450 [Isosphaeraceae bacterium]
MTPIAPARKLPLPPSPPRPPLVGHIGAYLRDPLTYCEAVAREYGDVVRLRLGPFDDYLIRHPDHIEYVLRVHHENYWKDRITKLLRPLVGDGLLTSEGAFWRRQRKLVQPGFQHDRIASYGEAMVACTERVLDQWEPGRPITLQEDMARITLAIVSRCLFESDVDEAAEVVGESLAVIMDRFLDPTKWIPLSDYLPLPGTFRYWRAIRRIDEVVYKIIRQRREQGGQGDLLGRLLAERDDEGGRMTDRQLRDEVVTLFLAGHETTALALTYTLHLLARHPEVEARLIGEIDGVLGQGEGRLVAGDVARLPYTEAVVRESMRLYPPAWSIGREALHDDEVGGFRAPRGTQFTVAIWLAHRDERWFDDPASFRPERWGGDFLKRLPRCAYMPFGGGPRICIGNHFAMMELVLVLGTILSRYRMERADEAPIEVLPSITLRPKSPVRMIPRSRRD